MANEFEWLDATGSSEYNIEDEQAVQKSIEAKVQKFLLDVQAGARRYKLIGSGKLVSPQGTNVKTYKQGSLTLVEIYMIYYGMFQNFGVKGWGDTKNAPNSPYSFKTKGMSESGIASIREMIKRGKKITRNVKYKKIGLETKVGDSKGKTKGSDLDNQVNSAVWNIKKYGIKTKPFYTEAWNKHFKGFDNDLFDAMKKQIIAEFKKK